MQEKTQKLEAYGVRANRMTRYVNFDELHGFGVDIIIDKIGRNSYYHIGSRNFKLPQLKLLMDTVQYDRGFTDEKSANLLKNVRQSQRLGSRIDPDDKRLISISGTDDVINRVKSEISRLMKQYRISE